MATYLSKEKRKEIFSQYGSNANDSGSIESQVALFTYRISEMSKHLNENKKDNSCKRTLLTLVGKRKRLLHYLSQKDITRYRAIIEKLNLRK